MRKKHKRHPFLILEVLIAFSIVALSLFPLLAPNLMIIQAERAFQNELEADRLADLLFAEWVENLYNNTIPWEGLTSGGVVSLDDKALVPAGFPYSIAVKPTLKKKKENEKGTSYYLFLFEFQFTPKQGGLPPLSFAYNLFVERL